MRMCLVVAVSAYEIGCGRLGFAQRVAGDGAIDVVLDGQNAPPALVQILAPGFVSAPSQTIAIDQTAGNVLLVATYWDQDPDTITLTDTAGLVFAKLPQQVIVAACGGGTGNATGAQLWYAPITTTEASSVTVAQTSGSQPLGMFLLEYSGIVLANPIDTSIGSVAPAASNAVAAPPLTTTADDLIVAFIGDTINMGDLAGGAGWTVEARDPGFPNMIEDRIAPAGTYIADGALPPGHNDACWVTSVVALRAR